VSSAIRRILSAFLKATSESQEERIESSKPNEVAKPLNSMESQEERIERPLSSM